MTAAQFFSIEEKHQIMEAIRKAEARTSGEIRVHVDNSCREEVLDRAAWWFARLKMHKTVLRNGVLFYFAVKDRKFAILGDVGINAVTPDDFWDTIKEKMLGHFTGGSFAGGSFAGGLIEGILMAGEALREHFPCKNDDENELTNDLSFGKS
jgi:uncharacterized membrane protein